MTKKGIKSIGSMPGFIKGIHVQNEFIERVKSLISIKVTVHGGDKFCDVRAVSVDGALRGRRQFQSSSAKEGFQVEVKKLRTVV